MARKIPVSVLIPAYNAQNFLRSAVDTIRSQTVEVEEIIIVDDESTDNTAAVAESLGARVLRERRGGPAGARNAGLAVAKSEWIATLDADDIWHPRKLELQYDAVLAKPELGLVFTDFDAVSASDGRIQRASAVVDHRSFKRLKRSSLTPEASLLDFAEFLRELPARAIVLPSSSIFRRELALAIGGFPPDVKAEDSEFFLRLASRTATAFLDVPLVAYMRHPTQITANWELDPVRLELHHHVMANQSRYHGLVISGFKKHYANTLYYSAANAASKKQYVKALAMLTKSLAVAISRGEVAGLSRSITQSRLLRSRLGVPLTDDGDANVDVSIVRDIEIPWRRKGSI
jgi:glycosyltransferase involved in cell wall biosynthesis